MIHHGMDHYHHFVVSFMYVWVMSCLLDKVRSCWLIPNINTEITQFMFDIYVYISRLVSLFVHHVWRIPVCSSNLWTRIVESSTHQKSLQHEGTHQNTFWAMLFKIICIFFNINNITLIYFYVIYNLNFA